VDGIDKQVKTIIKLFGILGDNNPIKYVIFSNNITPASLEEAKKLNATILTCHELNEIGKNVATNPEDLVSKDVDLEKIAIIM
jgi:hypothetical protein